MRRRRIMSMVMALCMLASMLAGIPAAAAEEYVWVYTLGFEVSNARDSATGKNNVQCHMRFGKDYEVFNVQGVNKKGTETRTEYQSTRAPWTLDTITFENNHKDAVKIRSYYMWVRRSKKALPSMDIMKPSLIETIRTEWVRMTENGSTPTTISRQGLYFCSGPSA